MADFEANNFGNNMMAPQSAGEVYVLDDIVAFTSAADAGDFGLVGYLPAGCVPIDIMAIADELDTNATDTLTFAVGLLNDDGDDLVSAGTFISGAVADTDPTITRGNAVGMSGIDPDEDNDRVVAVKITAAAATAAAGGIRVVMTYRASNYGA